MIAALYVQKGGCYFGLDGVDPWDEARDARKYNGPWPVVAHPPCARWCRLAGLVEHRWGYKRGDDGGCFAAALASVREHGGVLEHPAFSDAWARFDLPSPLHAGWRRSLWDSGHSCHVSQRQYGHRARKDTWLYAVRCELPEMRWGRGAAPEMVVGSCSKRGDGSFYRRTPVERLGKRERSASPIEFRDLLISMARSVRS
jgi:hypothetical protein